MAADARMLSRIPLFFSMDDEERAAIAEIMDEVNYEAGDTIYREDETGSTFYILQGGQVQLTITDDDAEKLVIETLGPGNFFGEISLLDGGTRSCDAIAVRPSSLLVLERNEFFALLMQRPHMAQDVLLAQAKYIRRTDMLLRRRVSRNANEQIDETETLGERVADAVARFGGSWRFIFSFCAFLLVWVLLNTVMWGMEHWDPYPFILLNLFLSMLAALQAPVIMMSQNRQDAKDRIRSELDYHVNLKAELGVSTLLQETKMLREQLAQIETQVAAITGQQRE
jgi:CRP/FNR family cyclic AMP-dependent transcriptional regulator